MTHAALIFGLDQAHAQMGWWWFILEAVLYCTGAAVYSSKCPEKWRPGKFDILGSSHQIFHVLVVSGALAHLVGIVQAFRYNHTPETRLCDLV
jgi:adiponectin receptor